MAYAANLHDLLFAAIETQYQSDADLLQLVPNQLYRDFAPADTTNYPLVIVSQSLEGGSVEETSMAAGLESADESFAIQFDITAQTVREASQIAWQIVKAFQGWSGDMDGVRINACYRGSLPWAGQTEQGTCGASVAFIISAAVIEE